VTIFFAMQELFEFVATTFVNPCSYFPGSWSLIQDVVAYGFISQ
jgi:hypothetical protein